MPSIEQRTSMHQYYGITVTALSSLALFAPQQSVNIIGGMVLMNATYALALHSSLDFNLYKQTDICIKTTDVDQIIHGSNSHKWYCWKQGIIYTTPISLIAGTIFALAARIPFDKTQKSQVSFKHIAPIMGVMSTITYLVIQFITAPFFFKGNSNRDDAYVRAFVNSIYCSERALIAEGLLLLIGILTYRIGVTIISRKPS